MRTLTIFSLLLFLLMISGCTQDIVLHGAKSDIVQIDLLYGVPTKQYGSIYEYETLCSLYGDEVAPFLDALYNNELKKHIQPQLPGGRLVIYIIYADGSVDILGDDSVAYQTTSELEHDGWYYLDFDVLYDLFSDYIDMSPYFVPEAD